MSRPMYVVKRDGREEPVHFDKITERIQKLCYGLNEEFVDPVQIAQKVVQGVYRGVTTAELDELAAETAAYQSTMHPDFSILAARIAVSNLHKQTSDDFPDTISRMHAYIHPKTGAPAPLISDEVHDIVQANKERIQAAIDYSRDFEFDFFGFKTLTRSYLLKMDGKICERPQHMYMRVAIGIHGDDVDRALETYDLMSRRFFTHATPTLFNAGTPRPQLSSCFLLTMKDDSISGIYDTLAKCANISKYAGGIGVAIHNIRATDSYIRGTNGTSNGIVPMLRVYSDTARYVDQGGGKRKGSFAIYLEPWHSDIFDFLELKKNHGKEERRARDLFYALWVPDLFMKRVHDDEMWSLFCPNEAPGLADVHSDAFVGLYERYEREGRARRQVRAQELWFAILSAQMETGTPYMLYKDACNGKSNQQNLGTIRCSNLCTEVVEFTSPDEVAVCNLASIALPMFANREAGTYDFDALADITRVVTRNLNRVIDRNYYPVEEARNSNMRHRPVGIGVQGLADTFCLLRFPFESEEARRLNRDIFETIYYAALDASCEVAEREGWYETFPGSPASEGRLQFDLWGVKPSDRYDWDALKARIRRFGLRNSLLVAPMPTASTAQILGNNESIEPFTSNIYNRRVLAGEFAVVNKHMMRDLIERGLWTPEIRNQIIADRGSVQNVAAIPDDLKELYKVVWEIRNRTLIDQAADRGPFICQSQSLNLYMAEPNSGKLTSMHFYAWRKGLKTGMYYLRTKPKADAIQFTVNVEQLAASRSAKENEAATGGGAAGAVKPSAGEEEEAEGKLEEPPRGILMARGAATYAGAPGSLTARLMASQSPPQEDDEEEGCLYCGS